MGFCTPIWNYIYICIHFHIHWYVYFLLIGTRIDITTHLQQCIYTYILILLLDKDLSLRIWVVSVVLKKLMFANVIVYMRYIHTHILVYTIFGSFYMEQTKYYYIIVFYGCCVFVCHVCAYSFV